MRKKSWIDKLDKRIPFNDYRMLAPRIWSPPENEKYEFLLREIDTINFDKSVEFDYFAPNLVSIQISIANQSIKKAAKVYNRLSKHLKNNKDTNNTLTKNLIKRTKLAYKYIELIQTSIVFSFNAIETFLNQSIPDDYIYIEKDSKKTSHYNKEQIERFLDWKIKIKKIVPDLYKINNITNQSFWSNLILLSDIRNNIIHQKSSKNTEIFEELFSKNIISICFSANDFLIYIYNEVQKDIDNMPLNIMDFPMIDIDNSTPILFKKINNATPIELSEK